MPMPALRLLFHAALSPRAISGAAHWLTWYADMLPAESLAPPSFSAAVAYRHRTNRDIMNDGHSAVESARLIRRVIFLCFYSRAH